MTSYKVVFKRFLSKIQDVKLASLSEKDRYEIIKEYFDSALGTIAINKLKLVNDLNKRDDELKQFKMDLDESEIEGIALFMVVAWYEPIVNSIEHTSFFMGSKDEKWSNQKDHINAMQTILDEYRIRAFNYFRNYKYRKILESRKEI